MNALERFIQNDQLDLEKYLNHLFHLFRQSETPSESASATSYAAVYETA